MITTLLLMRSPLLCRYFDTAFSDGVFGYIPDESVKNPFQYSGLVRTLWIILISIIHL
jgi:hypothetical protein